MQTPRKIVSLTLALFAITSTTLGAQSTGRAFTPEDWYKIARVGAGSLSPDGNTLAFTVTTVAEEKNARHTEVWIQSIAGGSSRRMTAPAFESTAPRWSDDGKTLYFTSTRPGSKGNTWAVRMDEGGDAFPADNAPNAGGGGRGGRGGFGGANAGAQPSDKSFTIYAGGGAAGGAGRAGGGGGRGGRGGRGDAAGSTTVANDPYSKMGVLARPPQGSITKPLNPDRFDGKQFTDERTRSNDAGFIPSRGPNPAADSLNALLGGRGGRGSFLPPAGTPPVQLFIQRGTGERKQITNTNYTHFAPSVSPDGKWVVFSADAKLRSDSLVARERDSVAKLPPNHVRDDADRNETDLYVLPVAACEAGDAAACKPKKIESFGSETNIIWSADSRQLAFISHPGQFSSTHLMLASVDGGKAVDILAPWKYEPGQIEWFKDGKIRMITTTGGAGGLWQVDPATKQVTPILAGRRVVGDIIVDKAQTKMVYTSTDVTHLAEWYTSDINGQNEKKLTTFNDALQKEVQFMDAERFTYKSVDNLEIEGWLMKPYGYQPGKKYPVVLYIHGGPHSDYNEGWFDEFQSLAGGGIFVLYTNPRGSSGTNGNFTNASRGDWGGKDYIDLMKGVDWAAARPDVDSTRMGVSGGSYGGFMTAWVETKTNRFKAAETDRMISDWTYWWGASDVQGLTNGEFFGRPWENQAMYDSLSPIRHVKNVKTPTLMVQSEDDFRTPMGNADLWYTALRAQGVQAEFVRYPRSTHELSRSGEPWLLVDRLGRIRQWFDYWLVQGGPKRVTQ
jgi:dipeptidyl aminopeptidase/acylaminoacyl peptidase